MTSKTRNALSKFGLVVLLPWGSSATRVSVCSLILCRGRNQLQLAVSSVSQARTGQDHRQPNCNQETVRQQASLSSGIWNIRTRFVLPSRSQEQPWLWSYTRGVLRRWNWSIQSKIVVCAEPCARRPNLEKLKTVLQETESWDWGRRKWWSANLCGGLVLRHAIC